MSEQELATHAEQLEKRLRGYFREVQYLGAKKLFQAYDQTVKWVQVFQCEEFLGKHPPTVVHY